MEQVISTVTLDRSVKVRTKRVDDDTSRVEPDGRTGRRLNAQVTSTRRDRLRPSEGQVAVNRYSTRKRR